MKDFLNGGILKNYEKIVGKAKNGMKSNNEKFCNEVERIVEELVR
jgi:hypothetical protein